jgi:hypothetical protein
LGFGKLGEAARAVATSAANEETIGCLSIKDLGLPSFRPAYLFLCRIPLDIMYECLSSKLEHQPQKPPSPLSLRQLLYECKETISGAVMVRQKYLHFVAPALLDASSTDVDIHVMVRCDGVKIISSQMII